ncbi:MAG TPA: hypothetical protein VEY06_08360, partial [Flavisolibacter sp.]|nr:hypothetical protein [Flavisolibacter sp.]
MKINKTKNASYLQTGCRLLFAMCLLYASAAHANNESVSLSVKSLTCEYQINPLGITRVAPRFSWQVLALKRNTLQAAYRILVATSPLLLKKNMADVWDSKTAKTSGNTFIVYGGKKLLSHRRYYWKVMVT